MSKFFCSIHKLLLVLFVLTVSIAAYPSTPSETDISQPRIALVLGGGGARGYAHIGVLKVLQQEHIPIDLIVGTSAGSIVGVLYANNPNVSVLEQIFMKTQRSDLLDVSALGSFKGPVSGNALQKFIHEHIKTHYLENLAIPFVAVATDLRTGDTVPLTRGAIAPAINASSALPPFFRPVTFHGRLLVDGGVTDPIAVDVAKNYHPEIVIAVSVMQNLTHDMPTNAVGIYDRSFAISDLRFNHYSSEGADVVIHPNVGQTGLFDDSHKLALIHAGEKAARASLPQICHLLQQEHIASACSSSG